MQMHGSLLRRMKETKQARHRVRGLRAESDSRNFAEEIGVHIIIIPGGGPPIPMLGSVIPSRSVTVICARAASLSP